MSTVAEVRFKMTAVLGKALEVGRAVLDDLDADQVPPSLRRVVAHSGALTPPLAEALAREIDRLEWLRERSLEAWDDADPAAEGPEQASALFLARPEGWGRDLLKIAWEAGAAAGEAESGRADRATGALQADLAAARQKIKSLQKDLDALRSASAAERKEARAPERKRRAAGARSEKALQKQIDEMESALAGREREIEQLRAEAAALGEEAHAARKERAAADAAIAELAGGGSWSPKDPIDLARHLDDLMAQSRRVSGADDVGAGGAEHLELPAGVRPDAPEAVDAVVRLPGPLGLVVDGYNAGLGMGEGTPAEVRSRLEDVLRRVAILGGPAMTVTVVWDSSFEQTDARPPGVIDVRFAPPGTPADDVVVAIAGPRVVVVTNDREVRERSEARGALTLWSDALVAWARRR